MESAPAHRGENLQRVRNALAEKPDGVLESLVDVHQVSYRDVLDFLPPPQRVSAPGSAFDAVWADLTTWGPIMFIVHTRNGVFETKGLIPPGTHGRGYFNIHGDSPIGGHLNVSRCAAIYFVDRPFFGRRSARSNSSTATEMRCSRSLPVATPRGNCSQTTSRNLKPCAPVTWAAKRSLRPARLLRALQTCRATRSDRPASPGVSRAGVVQFLEPCNATITRPRHFCAVRVGPTEEEIARIASGAVCVFLAAYEVRAEHV